MRGGRSADLPEFPGIEAVFGENPARFLHPTTDLGPRPVIDGIVDVARVDAWTHVEETAYGRPQILEYLEARRQMLTGEVGVDERTEVAEPEPEPEPETAAEAESEPEVVDDAHGEEVADSAESESGDETEREVVAVAIGELPEADREYASKEARAREADDVYRNAGMFNTEQCRERLLDEFAKGTGREPHIIDALEERLGEETPGDEVVVDVPVGMAGCSAATEEGPIVDSTETIDTDGTDGEAEAEASESDGLLMGAMG